MSNVLLIPKQAVKEKNGNTYVYIKNSDGTVTAKNTDQDDGGGNRYYGCSDEVSLVWGQKAPSKHENGGKKRPQNHKVGAESAPAQIRAEKVWGQKVPSKCKSGGKKRRQNSKVTAKSATTFKSGGTLATISVIVVVH